MLHFFYLPSFLSAISWAEPDLRGKTGGRVASLYPVLSCCKIFAVQSNCTISSVTLTPIQHFAEVCRRAARVRARYCFLGSSYPTLKPEQLDVLLNFVKGRDVFAILPTGFGKSLCYACLPRTFDEILSKERGYYIVVVVTPLLAIMNDQVRLGCV